MLVGVVYRRYNMERAIKMIFAGGKTLEQLDFIYKRHSVRKFTGASVPVDHLKEIVKAATYGPSGKNLQNWQFIVITNKQKINDIADIVAKKNEYIATQINDPEKSKAIRSSVHYHTAFKGAPVLVLVFACPYETVADILREAGKMADEEIAKYARPNPGIQNIAAAMENLLLAAANLGYGTCWMTGPTYAAEEITNYINFNKTGEGYFLAALTPLGVPASKDFVYPPRKPLEQVLTIID
jgi:nitroreductase